MGNGDVDLACRHLVGAKVSGMDCGELATKSPATTRSHVRHLISRVLRDLLAP